MERRAFGSTGLSVSTLGLGSTFLPKESFADARRLISAAIDCGINYIDTAPTYSAGLDEELVGSVLKELGRSRDGLVLATKVGYLEWRGDHRNLGGLRRQFDASLKRLGVSHVDVLQIHEADFAWWWRDQYPGETWGWPFTLLEESEQVKIADAPVVQFLVEARNSGKARFLGITGKNARVLKRIAGEFETDMMMVAHQLNALYRNAFTYLSEIWRKGNIGVAIGAPFMRGALARANRDWTRTNPSWMDEVFYNAYTALLDLAADCGISLAELSLRWLAFQENVTVTVCGCASSEEARLNAQAIEQGPLPCDLAQRIDALGIVHPLIYQGRMQL